MSTIPAITTKIVLAMKLKRVARDPGTSIRLAYLVTAALAKAVPPSTLIVPLIRHAATQNASEGRLVSANSAHRTPTVPAVRSAAVKNAKLDRAASVNRVPHPTTVKI